MTTAPARPRGRRPGHDDTRGTIREAAADLFAAEGYDRVSLRAIARAADVDPALVHHYFDSKADLYCEAAFDTRWDIDEFVRDILRGSPDQIGRRAAKAFFDRWDVDEAQRSDYLGSLTRDAVRGRHALTEMIAREVFTPIAAAQGHSNAPYRGQLAASALLGMMVARNQVDLPLVSSLSLRSLATPLGATLQHYLVDPW